MLKRHASHVLIAFINAYIDLQERHLEEISKTMRETVDGVMAGIQAMSQVLHSARLASPMPEEAKLDQLLMAMMGHLSRDDVITQRLEHVRMALKALEGNLTRILSTMDSDSADSRIRDLISELEAYNLRIYTTEEERNLHFEFLPKKAGTPPKAS